jgi:hypothetical protein
VRRTCRNARSRDAAGRECAAKLDEKAVAYGLVQSFFLLFHSIVHLNGLYNRLNLSAFCSLMFIYELLFIT